MKKILFALMALLLSASSWAYLTQDGKFSCLSGEKQDDVCAAECCSSYNGAFIHSDGVCLVSADTPTAKQMVAECEERENCCIPDPNYVPSSSSYEPTANSSCCLPAFLLLFVGVGMVATRR
ncbi:MAG: hypothetical protein V1492_03320 [Candidatus Micrarchaeota archaeon]